MKHHISKLLFYNWAFSHEPTQYSAMTLQRIQTNVTDILTEFVSFCQSELSSKMTWLTNRRLYVLYLLHLKCQRSTHNQNRHV